MGAKTVYINAEYIIRTSSLYFTKKYNESNVKFLVEDSAENVLGNNWLSLRRPVVTQFLARMATNNVFNFDSELVLYGKCYTSHRGFNLAELVLYKEISLDYTVDQFQELINKSKIKELCF